MINKEELKELASIEMQLGMSKYPDIFPVKTLKEFKEETDRMQWRKHILMESEKFSKISLGAVLVLSLLAFTKFGIYSFIPFVVNAIIAIVLNKKIKNIIARIKSNLYHVAYTDIIVAKWVNELETNKFLNHIEPRAILDKRGIKNYYMDNESCFDEKNFGKNIRDSITSLLLIIPYVSYFCFFHHSSQKTFDLP